MQFQELFNHQLGITSSLSWKKFNSHILFGIKQLSKTHVLQNNKRPVTCISLEKQDYRYLISGFAGGNIAIHDRSLLAGNDAFTTVARISRKKTGKGTIEQLQWYPHDTGMFFMLNSKNHVTVWDTNQLQIAESFTFTAKISGIHAKETGRNPFIAACSESDHNVYLCDLSTGSQSHTLKGHASPVIAVKWSPEKEDILYSASANGLINIWDVRKTKNLLATLHHSPQTTKRHKRVTSICFTPDGRFFLSLGADGTLKKWNTDLNRPEKLNFDYGQVVSSNDDQTYRSSNMEVSAVHRVVFVPNVNKVEAIELHTGKHVRTFNGHYKQLTGICYSDPFQELITCSLDASIVSWDNRSYNKDEIYNKFHQDCWSDVSD